MAPCRSRRNRRPASWPSTRRTSRSAPLARPSPATLKCSRPATRRTHSYEGLPVECTQRSAPQLRRAPPPPRSSIGLRSPRRCESFTPVRAPRATASSASARSSCLPHPPPAQLPAARRTATPRRTMGRQAYASYMSGIRHAWLHARARARACACARARACACM